MPDTKTKDDESYSAKESAKRRDEALKRALNTPPKPHKMEPKKKEKDYPKKQDGR